MDVEAVYDNHEHAMARSPLDKEQNPPDTQNPNDDICETDDVSNDTQEKDENNIDGTEVLQTTMICDDDKLDTTTQSDTVSDTQNNDANNLQLLDNELKNDSIIQNTELVIQNADVLLAGKRPPQAFDGFTVSPVGVPGQVYRSTPELEHPSANFYEDNSTLQSDI